jgi:hypothetical protein
MSHMKISRALGIGCVALPLLAGGSGITAERQASNQALAPSGQIISADVDADARAALARMGAALRSHGVFVLMADTTTEDVLSTGEKIQFGGTVEIRARRPDRFKISSASDAQDRQIYYDGKSVTIFSPRLGMYASFPAAPTIAQTLATARERYDVKTPLADLFVWGTSDEQFAQLRSGFRVRAERIDNRMCDHYAFRQEAVDWQIWIDQDSSALPCKLVITNTEDESRPQYSAVLHWAFPPTIGDDVFAFRVPSGSQKIVIVDLQAAPAGGKTR